MSRQDIEGLIYVVDITDHERMDEAARELQYFLDKRHKVPTTTLAPRHTSPSCTDAALHVCHGACRVMAYEQAVPVLVYANKIDMPRATLSMEQVAHQLGLHEVRVHSL
jgi:signal recognition particle receptor subunit beta